MRCLYMFSLRHNLLSSLCVYASYQPNIIYRKGALWYVSLFYDCSLGQQQNVHKVKHMCCEGPRSTNLLSFSRSLFFKKIEYVAAHEPRENGAFRWLRDKHVPDTLNLCWPLYLHTSLSGWASKDILTFPNTKLRSTSSPNIARSIV